MGGAKPAYVLLGKDRYAAHEIVMIDGPWMEMLMNEVMRHFISRNSIPSRNSGMNELFHMNRYICNLLILLMSDAIF